MSHETGMCLSHLQYWNRVALTFWTGTETYKPTFYFEHYSDTTMLISDFSHVFVLNVKDFPLHFSHKLNRLKPV